MHLLLVVAGYLAGSIPFGVLLARRAGVDVRQVGSGNVGATNVARAAGTGLGIATLVLDALKGSLPVLAARVLAPDPGIGAAVGLAAFAGHLFPITQRFAGGKGVATALGVLLVLAPAAIVAVVVVFAAVFAVYRYVSVASVVAALSAPVAVGILDYPVPYVSAALVMAAAIALRHRDNFRRLRGGTEPRFGVHKK